MNNNETPEQKAKRLGVPLIPERKEPNWPIDIDPTISVCGKCGLELKRVMQYVCPQSDCPTGLRSGRVKL